MIIDYGNYEQNRNKVYIHDGVFCGYTYDFANRSCKMILNVRHIRTKTTLEFQDVMLFESTGHQPWGDTADRAIELYFDKADDMVERIRRIDQDNGSYADFAELSEEHIAPVVVFCSGDRLKVLCKRIIVETEEFDG